MLRPPFVFVFPFVSHKVYRLQGFGGDFCVTHYHPVDIGIGYEGFG